MAMSEALARVKPVAQGPALALAGLVSESARYSSVRRYDRRYRYSSWLHKFGCTDFGCIYVFFVICKQV